GESGGSNSGVALIAHKRTVVRFFADAHGAEAGAKANAGGIPGVGAELIGYRSGVPLPGGPLYPDSGPGSLKGTGEPDPAPVLAVEGELATEQPLISQARQLYPLPEPGWNPLSPNSGLFIAPYEGVIDITELLAAPHPHNIEGERGEEAKAKVSEWASDNGNP